MTNIDNNNCRFLKKPQPEFEIERFKFIIEHYELKDCKKTESPDFIANHNGHFVGIELSSALNAEKERLENSAFKICNFAQEKYLKDSSIPIDVCLSFNTEISIPKNEIPEIVDKLVNLALKNNKQGLSLEFFYNDYTDVDSLLPKIFDAIKITAIII